MVVLPARVIREMFSRVTLDCLMILAITLLTVSMTTR